MYKRKALPVIAILVLVFGASQSFNAQRGWIHLGDKHVDDLAMLVDGPVEIGPLPGDLHLGLVDKPATPTACRHGRAASASSGVNRSTQRETVTWSTSTPRSASSSSTSRWERPKRRCQRTASTITSGGKRKPENADCGIRGGRRRRGLIATVLPPRRVPRERNSPFRGATVFPIYAMPGDSSPDPDRLGANSGIISCESLRQLAVLGECAPGVKAIKAKTFNLYGDNPMFTTQPLAGPNQGNATVSDNFTGLYLQSVLIKVDSPTTLETVRTFLTTHTGLSASGAAPRTFGEAVQARVAVGT